MSLLLVGGFGKVRSGLGVASFLGIDPSLCNTGWVVIDDQDCVSSGVIRTDSKQPPAQRLWILRHGMEDVIRNHRLEGSCKAAIEGYAYRAKGKIFELGEVGGVIRFTLFENEIPYLVMDPKRAKCFLAGKGTASKDEMAIALKKEQGPSFKTDHEVDAFVFANLAMAVQEGACLLQLNDQRRAILKQCKTQ